MEKDRAEICKIISEMLDSPDDAGIYPTTRAYDKLEEYIHAQRMEALGWMHAEACVNADEGCDPRTREVPEIIGRMVDDLELEKAPS